jgi:hypothetical protein
LSIDRGLEVHGSQFEAGTLESQVWETSEGLSAEPDDEEENERKPPSHKLGDDS